MKLFKNFFMELFKNNLEFSKFENDTELNESIILFCKKVYMNNTEIDLSIDDDLVLI